MGRGYGRQSVESYDDERRDRALFDIQFPEGEPEVNLPKNYRPWSQRVRVPGSFVSPFTGEVDSGVSIINPYYSYEAGREFLEGREEAIKALISSGIDSKDFTRLVKVRGYLPQDTGVSQIEEIEVLNPKFFTRRWSIRQALGKSIASRRVEATKLGKTYFEVPEISISSMEPVSYYKGKSKILNSSKGRFNPKEGIYILNSKGRWPKRDGHLVEITGKPKSVHHYSDFIRVPIFDLDTKEYLEVPLGYLTPCEEDILRWYDR